ncbi:hypothetical protein OG282_34550 [Streptomyces sp. NBC_01014]|nr:hypothetical protein OG282_34550 [Streptomyces sp. NBC_01014]
MSTITSPPAFGAACPLAVGSCGGEGGRCVVAEDAHLEQQRVEERDVAGGAVADPHGGGELHGVVDGDIRDPAAFVQQDHRDAVHGAGAALPGPVGLVTVRFQLGEAVRVDHEAGLALAEGEVEVLGKQPPVGGPDDLADQESHQGLDPRPGS